MKDDNKTVAIHTLGCRLNFSESGELAQKFIDNGHKLVPFGSSADVNFINTCTVTDDADSSCRNLIRKAHRVNPESKIIVAGCYAQMDPERIASMQGVDLVLGTNEKFKVFDYLKEDQQEKIKIDLNNEFWGASTSVADGHTRAFLKIQDGCNYICSFCIIPFARGRSRTITVADAQVQAKKLVTDGFKEIVLTGVNIGEYESSSGEKLEDLIKVVAQTPGLQRLRLSSVEPNTMTDSLLQVLKDTNVYLDHFHIPMQSGSDEILKKMRRKYDREFYVQTIKKIKSYFPNAAIGADIIVGFPGETHEQFLETRSLLEQLPITHFHVFPYSKRQKTTAAKMEEHIPHDVKKQRVAELRELGEKKLTQFSQNLIGTSQNILVEKRDKNGKFRGHTPQFVKVTFESEKELVNQIHPVVIDGINAKGCVGSVQV
jgi:threonylcarbamoyladenosine tRNA methylthiotransferase MtaB